MKIVMRPPCRECPFRRKALKGWLGPDSPREVWAKVHSDSPAGYPCHMDVAKASDEDLTDPDSVEQCVGALVHAKKTCKQYSDKWRQAASDALAAIVPAKGILGIEFMEHHGWKP